MPGRIKRAARFALVTLVLTGVVYPLLVTAASALLFPHRAAGSLIIVNGRVVGSELLGQSFSGPRYFHPRPSASAYDPARSGGSNLGPTSAALQTAVAERVAAARVAEKLPASEAVPVDLVTASGSGLDPDITVAAARLQASRVAKARGVSLESVLAAIDRATRRPALGIIGETRVNVLLLNLEIDGVNIH